MKPFSLYFHRLKIDLLEVEYPHLLLKGQEKKKLTLYPVVILKCKDIGLEKSKSKFQLLMGKSR